jgi:hypothetical protein
MEHNPVMMGKQRLTDYSNRQWRSLLGFPFATLDQASARLDTLQSQRDQLLSLCIALVKEWTDSAPGKIAPVYLAKSTDKSLTVLRWRIRKPTKTLSRTQLDKDLLNYFHVSGHQKQVLKFESRRQDLNHLTAMTLYEIKRLNDYLSQSRELAILKQANKQENTASHHHLITNKK